MIAREFSKWENVAVEDGDINPLVFRHQGMLLSEFVEFGGSGIKKALHVFAGEVAHLVHEKSTGYDVTDFQHFQKDVVDFLCKIELNGLCVNLGGDIRDEFWREFLEGINLWKPMPKPCALSLMLSIVAGSLTMDQYFNMTETPEYLKMIVEARHYIIAQKIITPTKLTNAIKGHH